MKCAIIISTILLIFIIPYQTQSINYDDFSKKIDKFFDDEFKQSDEGRVFYSHSMMIYDTGKEREDEALIRNTFSDLGLVSPKWYDGTNGKMQVEMNTLTGKKVGEMDFYKTVVGSCQMLVYDKWKNEIPSGVAIEVNHALDIGIPVFLLDNGKFILQKEHVKGLSYQETADMYKRY